MKALKRHGTVLLLLTQAIYAAYGRLISAPLWNPFDFQILHEAHQLSSQPWQMFLHLGTYFSQPLMQLAYLLEYSLFGMHPAGYYAVNLAIHAVNAFMVYLLVHMLFGRKRMAMVAALLFALGVGHYGKVFMAVAQQEALLLSLFYLLVLYFLIRSDFKHRGRLSSPYFLLAVALFLLSGLTKPTSFSLLGCLLAYRFFFYNQLGGKAVFSRNFLIMAGVGVAFYIAQSRWGYTQHTVVAPDQGVLHFTWASVKNLFRYLVLMVFPIQESALLHKVNPAILLLYDARTYVRIFLTMSLISFSFFGIVFGSRPLRFFIAWTFITVLPFTGMTPSGGWLNLTHLYLTSIGFCTVLAAGVDGAAGLLAVHRWRRYVPYLLPMAFVAGGLLLSHKIEAQNRRSARTPRIRELRLSLEQSCARPPAPPPDES
jgi:hypothetical protein